MTQNEIPAGSVKCAPHDLQIEETKDRLRIFWNLHSVQKMYDGPVARVVKWLVWIALGPSLMTFSLVSFSGTRETHFATLAVIGALTTLAELACSIYGRLSGERMIEWIEVSRWALTFGSQFPLSPAPKTVLLDGVAELGFGHYHFPGSDVHGSGIQLLIFPRGETFGHETHYALAQVVADQLKADIFNQIARYVLEHGIPLRLVTHPTNQIRSLEATPSETGR